MALLVCLKSKRHWSPRFRQCDDILQLFDNAFDFYLFDNIADVQIYGLKTAFCFGVFSSRSSSNDNHENVLFSRGFESPPGAKATGSKRPLSISTVPNSPVPELCSHNLSR